MTWKKQSELTTERLEWLIASGTTLTPRTQFKFEPPVRTPESPDAAPRATRKNLVMRQCHSRFPAGVLLGFALFQKTSTPGIRTVF